MTARALILAYLRGFCMGAADVIPGVSGGTMALVLGIYERLLRAVRAFDLSLLALLWDRRIGEAARKTDLALLIPLGAGIGSALLFFTRIVPLPRLLTEHPEPVYGLFFGLIVASVVMLMSHLTARSAGDLPWLAAGIAGGLLIVTQVPVDTPETAWFVFLSGMLAICAMMLPGISGSFVLLLLHKYAYVFEAVGRLDLAVLAPFGLGAVCGVLAFSRLLTWLLRRYHRPTMVTIIGILIASLWVVWPFQERSYAIVGGKARLVGSAPVLPAGFDGIVTLSLAMIVAGALAVFALERLAGARTAPGHD